MITLISLSLFLFFLSNLVEILNIELRAHCLDPETPLVLLTIGS